MDKVLFDFPCSTTFRAYEAEQLGEHLPDEPQVITKEPPKESDILKKLDEINKRFEQLYAMFIHLQNKLNDHVDKRQGNDSIF